MLPNIDHPEAFGQHPNADIASQIQETRMLFETLLSLQPAVSTGGGAQTMEEKVRLWRRFIIWTLSVTISKCRQNKVFSFSLVTKHKYNDSFE